MIYLAKAGDFYKVGTSSNPAKRVAEIQTCCPLEVRLIGEWRGEYEEEAQIHAMIVDKRVRGEWYDLDAEDVAAIGRVLSRPDLRDPVPPEGVQLTVGCTFCGGLVRYHGDPEWLTCERCGHKRGTSGNHRSTQVKIDAVLGRYAPVRCWR